MASSPRSSALQPTPLQPMPSAAAGSVTKASATRLAALAMSDEPLTSSTSLLSLLAPEVQTYILQQGARVRLADAGAGGSLRVAGAAAHASSARFGRRAGATAAGAGGNGGSGGSSHHSSVSSSPVARSRRASHPRRDPLPLVSPLAAVADEYLRQRDDGEQFAARPAQQAFEAAAAVMQPGEQHATSSSASLRASSASRTARLMLREHTSSALQRARSSDSREPVAADPQATDVGAAPHTARVTSSSNAASPLQRGLAPPSGSQTQRSLQSNHMTSTKGLGFSMSRSSIASLALASGSQSQQALTHHPSSGNMAPRSLLEFDSLHANKSALLSELDRFVVSELRALGLSDRDPPSLPRLQVYRQAFLRFMDHFESFKPLLSRVAREYDQFVAVQERQVAVELPSLQRKLATIEEQHQRAMSRTEERWKAREHELQQQIAQLDAQLAGARKQHAELEATHAATCKQLTKLQSTHQALLVSNGTLKKALTRYNQEKSAAWEEKSSESDLNRKLQQKLDECQKQMDALLRENALLRSHATAVQSMNPQEYARLQSENAEFKTQLQELTEKYQSCSAEFFQLQTLYNSMSTEREQMQAEKEVYERMKNSSTPRPQWSRLLAKHYLPDSCNLELQSSESLIDELCGEIDRLRGQLDQWRARYPSEDEVAQIESQLDEGVKRAAPKYLRSMGSGADVPQYLRWGKTGQKLRNKNISKRETEIFVKEVWSMKLHTPAEAGGEEYRRMSLDQFLFLFLKKKFGFQDAIAHYAYSILDSLDRFRFDSDCDMFLQILHRNVSESVYHDQAAMLDGLRAEFERVDGEYHKGRIKGRLPRKLLVETLTRYFSAKSDANIRAMTRALFVQDKSEVLNYRALFEEDREGNQGALLECIRDQHVAEIKQFSAELESKLQDKAARYDGQLRVPQIREVILMLDPAKPTKEVEAYIREGCDVGAGQDLPHDHAPIDPAAFFKNLSRRLIKRTGKPPNEARDELNRRGSTVLSPNKESAEGEEKTSGSAGQSPVPASRLRSRLLQAATPSEGGDSSATPDSAASRRSMFSSVARRISMPRQKSAFAQVVAMAQAAAAEHAQAQNSSTAASPQQSLRVDANLPSALPRSPTVGATPTPGQTTALSPALPTLDRARSLQIARPPSPPTPVSASARMVDSSDRRADAAATVLTLRRETDEDEEEAAARAMLDDDDDDEGEQAAWTDLSPKAQAPTQVHFAPLPPLNPSPAPEPVPPVAPSTVPNLSLSSSSADPPRSPAPVSPLFSPITTAVLATRKMMRMSMRKSGGLATMLAHMAEQDQREGAED